MPAQVSTRTKAYIYLLSSVILWGIATPVIKATVSSIPPFTFLMLRFWISGIVALPFAIYYFRKKKFNRVRTKHIIIAALLGNVLSLTFYFTGLEKTTAVEGSVLGTLSPLLISLFGFIFLQEIIKKHELEGTLLALLGSLIIIFEPFVTGNFHFNGNKSAFSGNILFCLGVIVDAIYYVYTKKHLSMDKIVTPFVLIAMSFVIAMIAFTPLGLIEQKKLHARSIESQPRICTQNDFDKVEYSSDFRCDSKNCYKENDAICTLKTASTSFMSFITNSLTSKIFSKSIWGVIYMAIFSGIIAYFLFFKGLQLIEASEASVFNYLQPVIAIPVAVIFLKESISAVFIIGAIFVVAGIFKAEKRE